MVFKLWTSLFAFLLVTINQAKVLFSTTLGLANGHRRCHKILISRGLGMLDESIGLLFGSVRFQECFKELPLIFLKGGQ